MSAASEPSNDSSHSPAKFFTAWVHALTLTERIHALKGLISAPPSHTEKTHAFLSRWRQAFARGDASALERRLRWDQIELDAVAQALDPDVLAALAQQLPLPTWAAMLERALAAQHASTPPQIIPSRFRSCRSPFVELWIPWVEFLAQQAASCAETEAIEASFWWDLKSHWLEQIAGLGADLLYQRFLKVDPKNLSGSYRGFIKAQQQQGWTPLLLEYPFLARQIGSFLEHALGTTGKLIQHLGADRDALKHTFALAPQAQLSGFEAVGDAHNGGASVARIRFSDASELIYKPRDCRLEASWQQLLRTLNSLGFEPALASVDCVAAHDHAWFALVQASQSVDRPAAAICFEQYGALVALAYIFGARDLHQDNVIVGAHGPVLIDCETVLQPQGTVLRANDESAMARAAGALENSCLSSGLVRFPAENAAGERWDESALCGLSKASRQDGWFNLCSDQLLPGKINVAAALPSHRVRCNDELLDASEFLAELCRGFQRVVTLLHNHQSEPRLLAAFQAFSDTQLRVVLRPSRSYSAMLSALRSAKAQRDGLNAGLLLETLARIWCQHSERPTMWPLLAGENTALLRGDVPVLRANASETWLACEDHRIESAWQVSAMDAMRQRLRELDQRNIQQQLAWLRSSLQRTEKLLPAVPMPVLPPAPPLGAGALRALVAQCAEQLLDAAVKGHDGELSWMAPSYLDAGAANGRGVSHYLYDGSLGIAWFLAAAGRVLGKPAYSDAALQAIAPVRRFLRDPAAPLMIAKEPLGIAHGLGSVVAGLSAIAGELKEPKLLEDAERAVRLIELRDLSKCEQAELESGLGGALLGICRLVEASGARNLLRCAKALAARIGELFHPERGWLGYDGHPLAGLMHGQSGIAYALHTYAALSQDGSAAAMADAAIRIEDRAFVDRAADWVLRLDHAGQAQAPCMGTWCNGAPGILPSRFAYGRKPDASEYARLEQAALALHQRAVSGVDHLCCGTLGAALSLAELSRLSGRSEGLERAREWLAAVAQAAALRGRFLLRVSEQENQCFQPGLYRGIAGVGFAALSLAWPEKVGSVLLFKGFEA